MVPPLPAPSRPSKYHHDSFSVRLDPLLEVTKFRLQPLQFLCILVALELWFFVGVLSFRLGSCRWMLFFPLQLCASARPRFDYFYSTTDPRHPLDGFTPQTF